MDAKPINAITKQQWDAINRGLAIASAFMQTSNKQQSPPTWCEEIRDAQKALAEIKILENLACPT
jgi:hypothetical protein